MPKATPRRGTMLFLLLLIVPGAAHAQRANPHDEAIDAMRGRSSFGSGDQRRIADWVRAEVGRFRELQSFRQRIAEQYGNPANSPPFKVELVTKVAETASARIAAPDTPPALAHALAQVLVDLDRPETLPGLIAGLKSTRAVVRYLCVRGLTSPVLRRSISSDAQRFDQIVQALRDTGLSETDPVILERIYEALNYPAKVAEVFPVYIQLFDRRLAQRRGKMSVADGAEWVAFEFFRSPALISGLDQAQKVALVTRIAVFFRLDAERYNTPDLAFREMDGLERTLDGAEEILAAVSGASGGNVREQLSKGGHAKPDLVLAEVYRWVGNPNDKTSGALNAAPWNIPVGAP